MVLFGRPLQALLPLADGTVASDGVVEVVGPLGAIRARALLPWVDRTEVRLLRGCSELLGLDGPGVDVDNSPACTLRGPAGSVVLAAGVVSAERVAVPGGASALGSTAAGGVVDVTVDGERPRLHRRVPVVDGPGPIAWIEDDTDDLTPDSVGRFP